MKYASVSRSLNSLQLTSDTHFSGTTNVAIGAGETVGGGGVVLSGERVRAALLN
jgi:hypothetical protein